MYVIVIGAGLIGEELVRKLAANRHDVVVVESNKETCDRVYSETGVIAINGSGVDVGVLREAGIEKADVVVASTRSDADNLVCAILAKSFGVDQVIVRMRNRAYEKAYELAGVVSIIRVADLMINQMMTEIEKPTLRRLMSVGGGKAEICSVVIPSAAKVSGLCVQEIVQNPAFPPQCVFVAVFNHESNEFSIPRGRQVIRGGDELIFISTAEDMKQASDLLTATG